MAADLLIPGALSNLLRGNFNSLKEPVFQVIDIKCRHSQSQVKGNRVEKIEFYNEIVLSDGSVSENFSIGYEINEMIKSKQLQKGSIVQLTRFPFATTSHGFSYLSVRGLNVIRCNCIILGDPKPFSGSKTPSVNKFSGSKTPSVNKFIPPKVEEEPVDPSVNKFIPPKVEDEPIDLDVNGERHHADEPTVPKQKCSSCSQTQSRKRQRQSSDNKEDGEIGACFEKLEKLGWEEGPMYDTVVLLFGESSDYRKIWLHLKPKSCVNWVKNAGGKYGLLG